MNKLLTSVLALSAVSFTALADEEKHHEDPTRIVTKAGLAYNDNGIQFQGSVGLDEARMLNAQVNKDASEWRLGGSWLLPMGILNFNFSRSEFDPEGHRNNYSVGTFVPLSYFDITPNDWQIFPMAGYAYNDGEIAGEYIESDNEYVMARFDSHGAYAGVFGVKPLTDTWSVLAFGGGSIGSDSYSGYWVGSGLSYKISEAQSFNFFGILSEDDFGENNRAGISYTYTFN